MSDAFDAALPPPYSGSWKQAERASPEDSPRLTSYQAPGGDAIHFILKSFRFSGGQSMDTAEYPFGGLWSNETLNEKPQGLQIDGFIRGAEYIQTRNALIEALRVTTDDSAPGFIDFPFWGRFPIVVQNYEISESADEKGQCALSLVFKRAGASIAERADSPPGVAASQSSMSTAFENAVEDLEAAAISCFEQTLSNNSAGILEQAMAGGGVDKAVNSIGQTVAEVSSNEAGAEKILSQGFGQIKLTLLNSLGRMQAAKTRLNTISSEINGITRLTSQLIRAPGQLARSLFNAIASIAAGLAEMKNSAASYLPAGSTGASARAGAGTGEAGGKSSYPAPAQNSEKSVLLHFLSASSFTLSSAPLTVRQEASQKAVENLYRTAAFIAAGNILAQLDSSFQKTEGYWKLFEKLESSIDKNDPAVYAALENVRICASRILSARDLSSEKKRRFNAPLPLLYIAQYLGCDEDKLRELNSIADSFVIKGCVLYV